MKIYFHGSDYLKNDYVPFPMLFFQDESYKNMSSDAKVLYALLLNRSQLSFKNGWLDENNRVYMYFAREDMCSALNVSQPTLRKAIKQLIDLELLDEVRQGLGKANRLYLLQPHVSQMEECFSDENIDPQPDGISQRMDAQPDGISQGKDFSVRMKDSFNQECNMLSGNNKELNNNKNNNILIREREAMTEKVKLNINFESFEGSADEKLVLSIVEIVADILLTEGSSYRIGKKYYDLTEVQKTFNQVNKDAVFHVIEAVKSAGRIANYRNYIVAVIFNFINNPVASQQQKTKNSFLDYDAREPYDDDLIRKIMEAQR